MYKRSIKPLQEFFNSDPTPGVYYVDTQFGGLSYQKDIAGTIHTRVDAGGCFFIVEVEEDESL